MVAAAADEIAGRDAQDIRGAPDLAGGTARRAGNVSGHLYGSHVPGAQNRAGKTGSAALNPAFDGNAGQGTRGADIPGVRRRSALHIAADRDRPHGKGAQDGASACAIPSDEGSVDIHRAHFVRWSR